MSIGSCASACITKNHGLGLGGTFACWYRITPGKRQGKVKVVLNSVMCCTGRYVYSWGGRYCSAVNLFLLSYKSYF